jgi:hypothetical protein
MTAGRRQRIERENREQVATIAKLCKSLALDFPVGAVTVGPDPARAAGAKQVESAERIHQLEAELALKRQEHNDLAQKLELYLAAASAGDQELKWRQAEKTAIIAAFQQHDETLAVSELEQETHTVHLDEETRRLCVPARDRLKEGYDMTKELHAELLRLQQQLSETTGRSARMEKVKLNDMTITAHQSGLKKLKNQIRWLTDANVLLRELVAAG